MMFFRYVLLLGCLCMSAVVWGQNEVALDSIWTSVDLEDVVVTAQYAPTAIQNALHPTTIIKAQDIQQEGHNNLAEVLNNQLNLRVNADPVLGNGLKIQGVGGENIQVMIDGVPVIGRLNGNIDLSQINLHQVQRIEIIEGAMSAQYGSNASGGVINIITKKSQVKKININTQNQYESIGIFNHALTIGGQLNKWYASIGAYRNVSSFGAVDSLRLYENIKLETGENISSKINPWNPKTQYGIDGTLRYKLNDSTHLTYQYRLFDETLSSYGEIRRPQFQPYAFDEFYTTKRADHSLQIESYFGQHFYFKSTTAYNQFNRQKTTQRLDLEADTTSMVLGGQDTTQFRAFLHRSILSTTRSQAWNAQLGVEFLSETGTGQRIVDTTSLPIHQANLNNYALWGSVKYDYQSFAMETNLRYGYNTKYEHPLIPSIHLKWKPAKDWQIQYSYAHGFRAPSLKELYFNFVDVNHYVVGNTDLKPEHSKNTALSFQYQKNINPHQKWSFQSKLFYNKIKNRIVLATYEPLKFNYQNLEQYETHGLNLQVEYQWKKWLKLRSGLAYTRLFNSWSTDFETDKYVGLYEMQNRLSLQIQAIKSNLILTHRYIGQQIQFYQNSDDVVEKGLIGDYHLINATMSRDFWKKRIFLAFGVKNILDMQTVPFTGQNDAAHSSVGNSQLLNWGRTFFIRLSLSI